MAVFFIDHASTNIIHSLSFSINVLETEDVIERNRKEGERRAENETYQAEYAKAFEHRATTHSRAQVLIQSFLK